MPNAPRLRACLCAGLKVRAGSQTHFKARAGLGANSRVGSRVDLHAGSRADSQTEPFVGPCADPPAGEGVGSCSDSHAVAHAALPPRLHDQSRVDQRALARGLRRALARARLAGAAGATALLAACGGGGDGALAPAPAPPPSLPPLVVAPPPLQYRVNASNNLAPGCGGSTSGTLYVEAEIEPHVAVSPADARVLIGAWQQDRWSGGAAQGVLGAYSADGGNSWTPLAAGAGPSFSRCTGGTAANGGDYERATDPWVSIGPDGTAYMMALAVSGGTFSVGSLSAMRVSRSTDGGRSWSTPATLIRDGPLAFNDKNALTADPTDGSYAYAVWDRLTPADTGPAWLARTTDGGLTWETARPVFDPGVGNQTIGAVVAVVTAGAQRGTVVLLFTQIDGSGSATPRTRLRALRSTDQGATWSGPVEVADLRAVGTFDPQTRLAVRDGALLAQIAAAPDGSLVAVWQDARFTGGQLDGVALSRSTDGGLTWSAPVQVNRIPTTAAFIPQVTVRGDGLIAVSYYDLRSDTADPATLGAEVWLAVSDDAGVTWRETRVAGPFDLALAPSARGYFVGDYHGLVASGTRLLPFFAITTGVAANRTDVYARPLEAPAPAAPAVHRASRLVPRLDPQGQASFDERAGAAIRRVLQQRGRLQPAAAQARVDAPSP
jgi:hypothetical protein